MRRVRLPLALLLAGLVLAGCGDDKETGETPEGQAIAGGSSFSSTWPLTGEQVTGDDSAEQEHPVLVTKIDNTPSSSPQLGLGSADLVVEELVEGGLTRLAVFFYSELPEEVGPVRSMRASDIGIVPPEDAAVVTSGAAGPTVARMKKAGITFYAEGAEGLYRDSARSAPYNLFANLADVADAHEQDAARPDDYLPWGAADALPGGRAAKTVDATFSPGHTTRWRFRAGRYVNQNSFAEEDDRFDADTVLALQVKMGDAGYLDPVGNRVPESKFEGTGKAWLFRGGRVVAGSWAKDGLDGALELSTRAGDLTVPPGHVWIELLPATTGRIAFR